MSITYIELTLQYICGTLVWLASRASVSREPYKCPTNGIQIPRHRRTETRLWRGKS